MEQSVAIIIIDVALGLFGLSGWLAYSISRKRGQKDSIDLSNKLERLELQFDLAVQGSHAGIYEWNISKGTITHNSIVDEMLGFEPQELPDLTLGDFIGRLHPDDKIRVGEAVRNHLENRAPYEIEFRMRKKDGSYIWVADSGLAMRDGLGVPILWAGTMLNITSRKEHEKEILAKNEELLRANKELDILLYRVSHDLKSPLNSIMGLSTLGDVSKDSRESSQFFNMIGERVKFLESYIIDLVESVKASRQAPLYEKLAIRHLVEEIVELLNPGIHNFKIEIDISQDLEIQTDRSRLIAVLNNLIGNAIKYQDETKEDKEVRITADRNDNCWILVVEDNGIGIEETHQTKVFEIFYRATDKAKGSGLGLHIVKEAVNKLGGTVELTSEYGMGTRVVISFPLYSEIISNESKESSVRPLIQDV